MCGIYICLGTNENEINNKQEHRGPDEHVIHTRGSDVWIFDRLSINDVEFGGQPFMDDQHVFMCNGEIYNHMSLSNEIVHELQSKSDCEPLFHLLNKCCEYDEFDQVCKNIDGEFAFVYANENHYVVARDPLGVRPLFMCVDRIYPNIVLGIGSEAKSLLHLPGTIQQFPPGNCMVLDRFYHVVHQNDYQGIVLNLPTITDSRDVACQSIRTLLIESVRKRLMSDRPVGYFLSGGLDSSIIASIGAQLVYPDKITTYSIGTKGHQSPDLIAAQKMAEHLNSNHVVIEFSIEEAIEQLENVIWHLESYDCTTIRASVPMYLLCNEIKKRNEHKALLSGEGADELFGGYLYLHDAPSNDAFQEETKQLLKNVHQYDLVRADRCVSGHGLEIRVPFFDKRLVQYVYGLDPSFKISRGTIEKKLLRDAFSNDLPSEIVNRQKNGMSDAVGYSWVDHLKTIAPDASDIHYLVNTPASKEEAWYRKVFHKHFGDKVTTHNSIWRPKWSSVMDPSARALHVHDSNNSFDK